MKDEILDVLCAVTGGPEFVRPDSYSPYYHYLDFELVCDVSSGLPVPMDYPRPLGQGAQPSTMGRTYNK